jgi:hypothetical protein
MNEHPIHPVRISAEYAGKRNQATHTIVQPPTPKRTEKKNSSTPNQASIINACLACMPPILKTKMRMQRACLSKASEIFLPNAYMRS